jgi:hypothetical protein
MPFFEYRQNNSFGKYVGPKTVFIEADDFSEANTIAEANGIYFGGKSPDGEIDCPCCGDRWHKQSEYDEPMDDILWPLSQALVSPSDAINNPDLIRIITREQDNG